MGEYLDGKEMTANILPSASAEKHYPIAFNLIPQIDVFCDNLYTKEEMKMVNETRKILDDYDMRITATTIRVPVYRSHSESVNIELEKDVSLDEIKKALAAFPGCYCIRTTRQRSFTRCRFILPIPMKFM